MAKSKKGKYGYCSGCGSRRMINGVCKSCGYIPGGIGKKAETKKTETKTKTSKKKTTKKTKTKTEK